MGRSETERRVDMSRKSNNPVLVSHYGLIGVLGIAWGCDGLIHFLNYLGVGNVPPKLFHFMVLRADRLSAGGHLAAAGLVCADPGTQKQLGFTGIPAKRIVYSGLSGALLHTGAVLRVARYCRHSISTHDVFVFLGRLRGNHRIGRPGIGQKKKRIDNISGL